MKSAIPRSRPLLAAILLLALSHTVGAYEPPEIYVQGLVEAWTARPPARDSLGFALSVAFVEQPAVFLAILDANRDVFTQWLASIREHTYHRTDPAEPGRGPQTYRLVIETARNWKKLEDRDLTEAIIRAAEHDMVTPRSRNSQH